MTVYTPDRWVMVKVNSKEPHWRIFATWHGGWTQGESWKMNSGVTRVEDKGSHYRFWGSSGSAYDCHKDCMGTSAWSSSVLKGLLDGMQENYGVSLEVLPPGADLLNLPYK